MMRVCTVFAEVIVLLVALAPIPAEAEEHNRTGFEFMVGPGFNACVESGEADCDSIDPSYAVLMAVGYRFLPFLGAYLDLTIGELRPEDDDIDASMFSLTLMPTVRGFFPFSIGEVYGGLGFGYSTYWATGTEQGVEIAASWSNLLNWKLTLGIDFNITRHLAIGTNVDVIFNVDESGEICLEIEGDKACEDMEGDIADLLQITVFLKGTF